jgi:hypothetical protein
MYEKLKTGLRNAAKCRSFRSFIIPLSAERLIELCPKMLGLITKLDTADVLLMCKSAILTGRSPCAYLSDK